MSKAESTVKDYIAARHAPVQGILRHLEKLVRESLPGATLAMKWGAPAFSNRHGTPVIYLYGGKDHANLGFVEGAALDDPDRLLKGSGKAGRHVNIFPGERLKKSALKALIAQCTNQE